MKNIFDDVSNMCSKLTTTAYSTSFSLGIKVLDRRLHHSIYGIYGFVRFADEIVDSFHGYEQEKLFRKFKEDTYEALESRISLNPILNSFQHVMNKYQIERNLMDTFLDSMEMDLNPQSYDAKKYDKYILGSAEVVGLMCLKVFVEGDTNEYNRLKPYAMSLGSAFQKVNFLRDANADFEGLGRTYFPGIDMNNFSETEKLKIEDDIQNDFDDAITGIKELPSSSRGGVYLAYIYYYTLFKKIKSVPSAKVLEKRIRVPNFGKIMLMLKSVIQNKLNLI